MDNECTEKNCSGSCCLVPGGNSLSVCCKMVSWQPLHDVSRERKSMHTSSNGSLVVMLTSGSLLPADFLLRHLGHSLIHCSMMYPVPYHAIKIALKLNLTSGHDLGAQCHYGVHSRLSSCMMMVVPTGMSLWRPFKVVFLYLVVPTGTFLHPQDSHCKLIHIKV